MKECQLMFGQDQKPVAPAGKKTKQSLTSEELTNAKKVTNRRVTLSKSGKNQGVGCLSLQVRLPQDSSSSFHLEVRAI